MTTILFGTAILLTRQVPRPLEIAVLTPGSGVEDARALGTIADAETLKTEAQRRRFVLLSDRAPFLITHRAFLDDSRDQVALDLLSLLKGYDPARPIRLEDLPDAVRSRVEPTMRRMLAMDRGVPAKEPIRFAVVPTVTFGVKETGYAGPLSPSLTLGNLSPAYRRPPLHPDADGYVADLGPSTLPNPAANPVCSAGAPNLDVATIVFSWTISDRARAATGRALWKALSDRLNDLRTRLTQLLAEEAARILTPTGALRGFDRGEAEYADVSPAVRRCVVQSRQWPMIKADGREPRLFLHGFGLELQLESRPKSVISLSLDYLLGAERSGGT